jgi:enoyl-CoA hydratase
VGNYAPDILSQRDGSVEVLTLNRPESLNAFTAGMLDHLGWSLRSAAADPRCRVIVVTGAGDQAFCAGVDIKAIEAVVASSHPLDEGSAEDERLTGFKKLHLGLSQVARTIHSIPVPVIAAVNGDAVGGGFALAAAADMRIATSNATFSDGFANRGVSGCEMGLSYFLPKLVSAPVAFDWMLSGRRVGADEACQVGLVRRVVESSELLAAALELGEMLAQSASMTVPSAKEGMSTGPDTGRRDHDLPPESSNQTVVNADAGQSFLEKRRSDF